ncbi:MAG: RNA 2'-phosphotransferase, partial [Candidatus Obscuribacterales bacterium]|nr:RNA 2'-phosphotransferase [Candidatus Obscuribacterales bacterium]
MTTSKFLALVLRHKPETIGLELDESGWVSIDDLLAALSRHGKPLELQQLHDIVKNNDKKRFAISED